MTIAYIILSSIILRYNYNTSLLIIWLLKELWSIVMVKSLFHSYFQQNYNNNATSARHKILTKPKDQTTEISIARFTKDF